MGSKTLTPICDFIHRQVAKGMALDLALGRAMEREARATKTAMAMAYDVEIINRRRAWDRDRKAKSRAAQPQKRGVKKEIGGAFAIVSGGRPPDRPVDTRQNDRKISAIQSSKNISVQFDRDFPSLTSCAKSDGLSIGKEERTSRVDRGVAARDLFGGRPAKHGIPLPDDWAPSSGHYIEGQRLGLSRQDVDDVADRLRNWATAEAHRSIARKADRRGWDACFVGTWLRDAADVKKRTQGRGTSLGDIAFRGH